MFRLGFLFVTVTTVELIILMQVGKLLGLVPTIGLILVTGFLGAYLTRMQGLRVLQDIAETLQRGEMPANEILSGVCLLVVGALLVTPGLLTDITGFLLLIPSVRARVIGYAQERMRQWLEQHTIAVYQAPPYPPYTIDQ